MTDRCSFIVLPALSMLMTSEYSRQCKYSINKYHYICGLNKYKKLDII
jgi:hypothetical protein